MNSQNNKIDGKAINTIISISSIAFCFIGIISNLTSILVCLRKEMREVPTFIFLMILSFINILKLISIALIASVLEFHELGERCLNIMLFIIFWEHQSSAYFKVIFIHN